MGWGRGEPFEWDRTVAVGAAVALHVGMILAAGLALRSADGEPGFQAVAVSLVAQAPRTGAAASEAPSSDRLDALATELATAPAPEAAKRPAEAAQGDLDSLLAGRPAGGAQGASAGDGDPYARASLETAGVYRRSTTDRIASRAARCLQGEPSGGLRLELVLRADGNLAAPPRVLTGGRGSAEAVRAAISCAPYPLAGAAAGTYQIDLRPARY